jgi:hypothetical protein
MFCTAIDDLAYDITVQMIYNTIVAQKYVYVIALFSSNYK